MQDDPVLQAASLRYLFRQSFSDKTAHICHCPGGDEDILPSGLGGFGIFDSLPPPSIHPPVRFQYRNKSHLALENLAVAATFCLGFWDILAPLQTTCEVGLS